MSSRPFSPFAGAHNDNMLDRVTNFFTTYKLMIALVVVAVIAFIALVMSGYALSSEGFDNRDEIRGALTRRLEVNAR